jgi:hypothetical protein
MKRHEKSKRRMRKRCHLNVHVFRCGDPSVFVKQKESMGSSNWKCVVTLDMSQPTRALNAALMDDDEEEEEEEQGERREAKDEVGGDEGEGGFETEGADVFEMHDCQTILFGHGPTEKLMLLVRPPTPHGCHPPSLISRERS